MGGYQRKQITGFQKLDELERLMSRITFRVGDEVLDLPPATEVTYHCDLTGEAARIYKDLEEDFVARVKDGTVTAANAMVKLLRLQQVTGGCVPTDDHTDPPHRFEQAETPGRHAGGYRQRRAGGGVLPVHRRPPGGPRGVRRRWA